MGGEGEGSGGKGGGKWGLGTPPPPVHPLPMDTLASSEDAEDRSLHCLSRSKQSSGTDIHTNLELLKYKMSNYILIQYHA